MRTPEEKRDSILRLARCLIPSSPESLEEEHRLYLEREAALPPMSEEEERAEEEEHERIGRMLVANLNANVLREHGKK